MSRVLKESYVYMANTRINRTQKAQTVEVGTHKSFLWTTFVLAINFIFKLYNHGDEMKRR